MYCQDCGREYEGHESGLCASCDQQRRYELASDCELRVGMRVRLVHNVERYPHFVARKGMTGTVSMADMREAVCVRLDEFLPGAEDWDNEVCWYPQNGDDPSADLETVGETQ